MEDQKAEQYSAVFGALSEPVRLSIIRQIAIAGELPCSVLDDELPISKSTISYHIKTLYQANLISLRKSGRNYFYKLETDTFEEFLPGFLAQLTETIFTG